MTILASKLFSLSAITPLPKQSIIIIIFWHPFDSSRFVIKFIDISD
jgi:hypothetical protein